MQDRQVHATTHAAYSIFSITCNHRTHLNMTDSLKIMWIPGYFLAVRRPVPDVLLLLLHAMLDPDSTRTRHRGSGRACGGAEPGAAVWGEVMWPRIGASPVLLRIPVGAKLFLGGGAVLWRQTSPPAAARHWWWEGNTNVSNSVLR